MNIVLPLHHIEVQLVFDCAENVQCYSADNTSASRRHVESLICKLHCEVNCTEAGQFAIWVARQSVPYLVCRKNCLVNINPELTD